MKNTAKSIILASVMVSALSFGMIGSASAGVTHNPIHNLVDSVTYGSHGYNQHGYNRHGYNVHGYNSHGYNTHGYNNAGHYNSYYNGSH